LVKVDRASMACSLEVRAPFLDVDLVSFLSSVPPNMKLRRFDGKQILKRAMEGRLPPGITGRQKKGFGIPVAEWLKAPLRGMLEDELSVSRLETQGLFAPSAVRQLVSEHMSGRRDHRKQLWTLLMFQLWYRRWYEGTRRTSGNGFNSTGGIATPGTPAERGIR
jgi:asparagine synthase (glutamine-hydrolysing)